MTETIPYIIQEDGFYYVAYKEKVKVPGIIVSSKGVANGLSEEYNDGWDFGPDSYDPNSTAKIPYTQTSGILEAKLYADSKLLSTEEVIKIKLTSGRFVFSPDATLFNLNSKGINGQPEYALIPLLVTPFNSSGGFDFSYGYDIEGSGGLYSNGGGPSISTLTATTVIDYSQVTASAPSGNQAVLFGYQDHIQSNGKMSGSNIKLTGFAMYPGPNNGIGGIDLYGSLNSYIDDLALSQPTNSQQGPFLTQSGSGFSEISTANYGLYRIGIGIAIDAYYGNEGYCGTIAVSSVNIGVVLGTHMSAQKVMVQSCGYGLIPTGGHGAHISYYDVQSTIVPLALVPMPNSGLGIDSDFTSVTIDNWAGEANNYGTTAGYTQFDIFYTSTSNGHGKIGIIQILNDSDSTQVYPNQLAVSSLTLPSTLQFKIDYSIVPVVITLSANPPVSGTVYQNTNPYDIEIDLPVYATTSGTAGYVTIAKGSTDTPTAIGNQYVSGDTSSTATQIIRVRVPAGWYYEFTGSGVTFTTATAFAE